MFPHLSGCGSVSVGSKSDLMTHVQREEKKTHCVLWGVASVMEYLCVSLLKDSVSFSGS